MCSRTVHRPSSEVSIKCGDARPAYKFVFRCWLCRTEDSETALINQENLRACEYVEDDITLFYQNGSILDKIGEMKGEGCSVS